MKKRSFLQLVLVAGMCCAAFACGWVGYRRHHPAMAQKSTTAQSLTANPADHLAKDPELDRKTESRIVKNPKLVAFQLQSTPEMLNFRPGDRIDVLTSIKRRDIPLVYDATVLQSNSSSFMFLVPLSESEAVSQAIAEGKDIKLVPSSTGTSVDNYRPA